MHHAHCVVCIRHAGTCLPPPSLYQVHLYEHLLPLQQDCRALTDQVKELTDDLSAIRLEHGACGEVRRGGGGGNTSMVMGGTWGLVRGEGTGYC